jgi:phage baseplate assembly protein W
MATAPRSARLFGKSIAFPPRIAEDGRWAWSEGPQNVRESIQIILLTDRKERLMLPEFGGGLTGYLFEPNITATHRLIEERIRQSLKRWDARIKIQEVTVREDPNDPEAALATIRYQLIATGQADAVNVAVPLTRS